MATRSSMWLRNTLSMLACYAALYTFVAEAAPGNSENGVIRYLEQFGYLPQPHSNNSKIMTEESLSEAISEFQSFMGVKITGKMDDETTRLMKIPRCGFTDKVESSTNNRSKPYSILGDRWRKQSLTYRVSKYSKKLNPGAIDQVIANAFAVWAQYVPLNFRPASYGEADIEIRFERGFHVDDNAFDGTGGILAHAFAPGPGIGGDVHFDDDENWTIGGGYGTDFFQIAVHEIGHALGLDHSRDYAAIMYPTYRPGVAVKLGRDDIAGIEALYQEDNGVNNGPVVFYGNPWYNVLFPRQWPRRRFFW